MQTDVIAVPGLAQHRDRPQILAELHARPIQPAVAPLRVYHLVFMTGEAEARVDREAIARLSAECGLPPPGSEAKHFAMTLGSWELRWEQHTEFTTYRWSTAVDAAVPFSEGLAGPPWRTAGSGPPGELIAAVHVALVPGLPDGADLAGLLHPDSLCRLETEAGRARVACDFRVDGAGFTRFLIEDRGLDAEQAGALLQRVLEIETYRTLALLGLPVARRSAPVVRRIEQDLATLTREIAQATEVSASQQLLHRLTGLAAEIEAHSAETRFRFAASRAYHDLVKSRLLSLKEVAFGGHPTITGFFRHRLVPAMATCAAIDKRQTSVSNRLMRAADLLRTRLQFDLEQQNRDLLQSMNQRARLQLRLQETVEGLSVAAVSYYVVGLVGYLIKGFDKSLGLPHWLGAETAAAVAVPVVIFAVWMVLRRVRARFGHDGEEATPASTGASPRA